jgi:hypothetical protein
VDDRIRTGDRLDHNQELYQLSYVHRVAFNLPKRPPNSPAGTLLLPHRWPGKPGPEQGRIGLGVEGQAPGAAVPEGLVLRPRRGGERYRAVRQVEDVSVPVEDCGWRSSGAG